MKTEEMVCELRRLEEVHKNDFVGTCETNWSLMCHDVANRLEELLTAQEPRVMTLEEIRRRPDFAWIEEREPSKIYIALFDFNAISGLWEYAHIWNKYGEDTMFLFILYNKRWRCWTQRPTDEQREAIPWN